jgi:hypothetical protein
MSNIAQSLAVPVTAIAPDAVIVALPADCIRNPVTLLLVGLFAFSMVASFAVRVAEPANGEGPVLLARLTALT